MKITLLTDINVGGKFKKKESVVETTKNEASQLIQRGYAESEDSDKKPNNTEKWQTVIAKDEDGNAVTVNDMTVPKLKQFLEDNEIEFKSDLRSDDLKDLVEAHLNQE